jgi:ABC-type polysaccharide/polyol phosphate transport system ATPase subunit
MVSERDVVLEHVSKAYRPRRRAHSLAEALYERVSRTTGSERLRWVLRDVCLTLRPGDTVGVIGRNGAGKSTLLKIMAGIAYPTSGRVHVPMRVSTQFALGAGVSPFLTGVENAFLQGTVLGLSNHDVRSLLPQITEFSGLGEDMKRPLWTYSTGMAARLAFAVAVFAQAELMLIDEALSAGDAAFHERCRTALADAKTRGRTIVVVSHSDQSIRTLCDRALWLDRGRVRCQGPTEEVLAAYKSDVAATTR